MTSNFDNTELRILKTIITHKKQAIDFATDCDPKIFSSELWNFANIITNYIKNYKDVPTLRVITEKLSKSNNQTLINKITQVWEQLNNINVDPKEFNHDLGQIKKRFAEKQLLSVKNNIAKEGEEVDINKAISEMQKTVQTIHTLNNPKSFDRRTLKEALPAFVEKFNAKRLNPNLDKGIKTGYHFFDDASGGLRPADFLIITASSGFGKSMLLNNMCIQMWLQNNTIESKSFTEGKNILFFSLEMPYEECFNRLLSRLSQVPIRRIEEATINKEEFARLKQALDFIKNYPYHFEIVDIADASANDLEVILNETQFDVDAMAVDYLGIMKANKHSDEADWQLQGRIAYECRSIARKHKLPILTAVQLNRKSQGKDSSDNIGLNRLARSATIATHATAVIQIEDRPNEENYSDMMCHIIKLRKGPKNKGTILKDFKTATLLDNKPEEGTEEYNYDDYFKDRDSDISKEIEKLEL